MNFPPKRMGAEPGFSGLPSLRALRLPVGCRRPMEGRAIVRARRQGASRCAPLPISSVDPTTPQLPPAPASSCEATDLSGPGRVVVISEASS